MVLVEAGIPILPLSGGVYKYFVAVSAWSLSRFLMATLTVDPLLSVAQESFQPKQVYDSSDL